MSIENLLNPADETPITKTVTSVQKIFTKRLEAEEETKANFETPPEPAPTANEAMKAVSILLLFVEADTCADIEALDQPLQKLERLIGNNLFQSFNKQTTVTDFFKPISTQHGI